MCAVCAHIAHSKTFSRVDGVSAIGDDGVMVRPPERIDVAEVGVVLRRHLSTDIDALHTMIEESRDHLRPFMPWADQARDETAAFVAKSAEGWEAGTDFNYLVAVHDGVLPGHPERLLGGAGLDSRPGPGALEIGYWLRPDATGCGVMTAVSRCLSDVAVTLAGVDRVVICCDEANVRSLAIPRRLGFSLDRFEERPVTAPGEHGRSMVWVRHRTLFP